MSKVDKLVMLFPVAVFFLVAFLLALSITRQDAIWLLEENHLVEMLTFVFLLAGGLRGFAVLNAIEEFLEMTGIVVFVNGLLHLPRNSYTMAKPFKWTYADKPLTS